MLQRFRQHLTILLIRLLHYQALRRQTLLCAPARTALDTTARHLQHGVAHVVEGDNAIAVGVQGGERRRRTLPRQERLQVP